MLYSPGLIIALLIIYFSLWTIELIILSGDVHPNPGPNSVNSSDQSSEISFSNDSLQEMLARHLSIFHLNIQSLRPNIDLVRAESEAYDIAVFSESWLKPDISDDEVYLITSYLPFDLSVHKWHLIRYWVWNKTFCWWLCLLSWN